MLHFNGGGVKGKSGFDDFPLFEDLKKMKDVYDECSEFCLKNDGEIRTNELYGDLQKII
jgi:hypothetical protein